MQNIGGKLCAILLAQVSNGVNNTGWDKEIVSAFEDDRVLSVNSVLKYTVANVNDLLARMSMAREGSLAAKVNKGLNSVVVWDTDIML